MTSSELNERYFKWMLRLVSDNRSYQKLLRCLHETEFIFKNPMDDNRAQDGIGLRYRFGYEEAVPQAAIACYLDVSPCSLLEMMTALALRCEENIMDDPDIGNRLGEWFWGMIRNLGLADMTDSVYDQDYVDQCIRRFLNRKYEPDGKGGLFHLKYPPRDLRQVEIWYQACWYMDEMLNY